MANIEVKARVLTLNGATGEILLQAYSEPGKIHPGEGVTIMAKRTRRRNTQNALMWLMNAYVSKKLQQTGQFITPEQVHELLKYAIDPMAVRLRTGKVLLVGRSTANLSVSEFAAVMDARRVYIETEMGISCQEFFDEYQAEIARREEVA